MQRFALQFEIDRCKEYYAQVFNTGVSLGLTWEKALLRTALNDIENLEPLDDCLMVPHRLAIYDAILECQKETGLALIKSESYVIPEALFYENMRLQMVQWLEDKLK